MSNPNPNPSGNALSSPSARAALYDEIEATLGPHLADCEHAVGLPAPNPAFRDRVVTAIAAAITAEAETDGTRAPAREWKTIRKKAQAVVKALAGLEDSIQGSPFWRQSELLPWLRPSFEQLRAVAEFSFSAAVARQAKLMGHPELVDRGGPDESYGGFEQLVAALARTYQDATGKRASVTRAPDKYAYSGRFLALLTMVLPPATAAAARRGWCFHYPPEETLGRAVERILVKMPPP